MIQFADDGMERSITIREGVDVILNCSLVVERLDSDNPLVPLVSIMVTWFIQKLDTDLVTLGGEEPLSESSPPFTEGATRYVTRLHLIMC